MNMVKTDSLNCASVRMVWFQTNELLLLRKVIEDNGRTSNGRLSLDWTGERDQDIPQNSTMGTRYGLLIPQALKQPGTVDG